MTKLKKSSFWRREEGVATVEVALWFPLLMAIFGLMLDMAMIFHGQAKVLRVVQDANRELSVGRYADTTTTQNAIIARLSGLDVTPVATTTTITAGVASTTVSVPARQLAILGFFGTDTFVIDVTAEHMIENWET